jgi:phenylpropionate dioxygenase-like ring-hydroxylating dioxygenase large terminal subunit
MKISTEERGIIQDILDLAEQRTTHMLPDVMENPVAKYNDPKQLEDEINILFRNFPIIIGHASDLQEPGSFLTQDIAGAPVLVTRGRDDRVRAFLNVCRHRGAQLEARPCGKAATFSCPYHAWTYGLDGRLRGMPQAFGFDGVDRSKMGLVELPAYEHFGFIWVVPSVQEREIDIAAWTAPFQDYLGGLDLGSHHVYRKWSLDRDMGWRIALEGFQESYHFCAAHATTACSGYLDNQSLHRYFRPHWRHAVPTPKVLELRDQDPETWEYRPYFMDQNYLFPANFVQVMSDHVYVHTILPTGPGTCTFQCMMLIAEAPKTEKAERYWQKNYDLIRVVFGEDFEIGEGIQKGLDAGANQHFVFGKYEVGLQFGQQAIDDAIAGKIVA